MPRTALVTGGVTGIGAATAKLLKEKGYGVAVNYFGNDEEADRFVEETGIPAYSWNVASFSESRDGIAKVVAELGSIDILINNAGITRDGTLHKMTEEQWRSVIDVDLGGCFNMCRAVIEGMRARRFGRIVNISSVNGLSGQFGQTNYAAAKAGLLGLTKSLAREFAARSVTVNAIAPGFVDTDMTAGLDERIKEVALSQVPLKRFGKVEDIAEMAAFLCSDKASYVTGQVFTVDGGMVM